MVKSLATCVMAIFALSSFVKGLPRDLSDEQGQKLVSRIKRLVDEDIPPPFGLFPNWKRTSKPTRATWIIFNFPTSLRSTTHSPKTTKPPAPPPPKQPPTPPISINLPVRPTPATSTSPASTTKWSDQVTTTQTEKLPTTATEAEPTTTSTVITTTEPETTTRKPTTTSRPTTTPTTATTVAPTTTPRPTVEDIPGAFWVEKRFKRHLYRFGQYIITANITSGPPVLIVRPQPLSRRDVRVKKYFSKCEIRLLSKKDRSQKKFEAEYSTINKRCAFTIKTLSPNTRFRIRARMKSSGVVLNQRMFKWSMRYEGFQTGQYVYQEKTEKKGDKKKEEKQVELPSECQDLTWQCSRYAKIGDCVSNPRYMEQHCTRSCPGLCRRMIKIKAALAGKDVCVDMSHSCQWWARSRYCTSDRALMWEKCRESCGWCNIKKFVTQEPCEDALKSGICKTWAKQGICTINPRYMYRYCLKSCNKC